MTAQEAFAMLRLMTRRPYRLRYPIEVPRLVDIGSGGDARQGRIGDRRIDVNLHEGVFTALLARAVERGDVDSLFGDDLGDLRDHSRTVAVEQEQGRGVALESRLEA